MQRRRSPFQGSDRPSCSSGEAEQLTLGTSVRWFSHLSSIPCTVQKCFMWKYNSHPPPQKIRLEFLLGLQCFYLVLGELTSSRHQPLVHVPGHPSTISVVHFSQESVRIFHSRGLAHLSLDLSLGHLMFTETAPPELLPCTPSAPVRSNLLPPVAWEAEWQHSFPPPESPGPLPKPSRWKGLPASQLYHLGIPTLQARKYSCGLTYTPPDGIPANFPFFWLTVTLPRRFHI